MKKMLVLLLVFLMAGLFVGCPEKPNEEEGETIAKEYQGKYEIDNETGGIFIVLTKNKFQFYRETKREGSYAARTDENKLYAKVEYTKGTDGKPKRQEGKYEEWEIGSFKDDVLTLDNYPPNGYTSDKKSDFDKVVE